MSDTDIDNISKKSVEKKKDPQVVNILKESVGATIITKQILNLRVNFLIGKELGFALAVKKQLTKAIFKDKAV